MIGATLGVIHSLHCSGLPSPPSPQASTETNPPVCASLHPHLQRLAQPHVVSQDAATQRRGARLCDEVGQLQVHGKTNNTCLRWRVAVHAWHNKQQIPPMPVAGRAACTQSSVLHVAAAADLGHIGEGAACCCQARLPEGRQPVAVLPLHHPGQRLQAGHEGRDGTERRCGSDATVPIAESAPPNLLPSSA